MVVTFIMSYAHGSSDAVFQALLWLLFILTPVTALATSFITAPYGRHVSSGWGPHIPSRLGWIIMESPTLWVSFAVFSRSQYAHNPTAQVLIGLYWFHYIHRVLIYPWRARLKGKSMPLLVAAMAFAFNLLNAYLQAYQVGQNRLYPNTWLTSLPFVLGVTIFCLGFIVNVSADSVLLGLRSSDQDKSYKIPTGLLIYNYISCPNYFGEIVEWLGWAILTWSPAGLAFFLYACANLIPRAISHHAWYVTKFEDYPKQRKAVIPFFL